MTTPVAHVANVDATQADAPVVRRLPDRGVLVSYGGLFLLCEPAAGAYPRLGELIDALATAAASGSGARQMSRLLGGLLGSAGPDAYPALCAFGQVPQGLVAIVYGDAQLMLMTAGGQARLDGRDARDRRDARSRGGRPAPGAPGCRPSRAGLTRPAGHGTAPAGGRGGSDGWGGEGAG